MKNLSKLPLPDKLAQGRKCFERWRGKHKPRTRLPKYLWSLATELAREFGLNQTASTLRLDYYGLKKRLEPPVVDNPPPATSGPAFLELLPADANLAVECTIECQDADGTQIRIHLKGQDLPGLTSLCSKLWNPDR